MQRSLSFSITWSIGKMNSKSLKKIEITSRFPEKSQLTTTFVVGFVIDENKMKELYDERRKFLVKVFQKNHIELIQEEFSSWLHQNFQWQIEQRPLFLPKPPVYTILKLFSYVMINLSHVQLLLIDFSLVVPKNLDVTSILEWPLKSF